MKIDRLVAVGFLALGLVGISRADDPKPEPVTRRVADIVKDHDRSLHRDLADYVRKNPKADDVEQAYLALFEKAIEHDWFAETEPLARSYLATSPEGPVRPLALIVSTMARAQDGKFEEALGGFSALLKDLDKQDQKEFATNFADSLAAAASGAGEAAVAKRVYEALLDKYGDSASLRDKVRDDLARIAMIGRPAPSVIAKDIDGRTVRLSDYKGKYVLVDFWATWCGPCIGELPNLKAAYAKYHDKGFDILGVSLDETADPVADFAKARKIPWKLIHNGTSGTDVVDSFSVNNIPSTFLVAPDGKVTRIQLRGPELEKALEKLIK